SSFEKGISNDRLRICQSSLFLHHSSPEERLKQVIFPAKKIFAVKESSVYPQMGYFLHLAIGYSQNI
ncbi:MAG: hypothetical protein KBI07_06160, partial [Candidatus Atribacteria bacterium]|nr:hypothetical protein [Candidatus Atribacteria bacterium]